MRSYPILVTPFLFLFLHSTAAAQTTFEKVDRDRLRKEISDRGAPTEYPKLLARYNAFDTTLTLADYRRLYYGFVFQGSYSGYADHQDARTRKAIEARQFDEAIRIADSVLSRIPISLSANYNRGLAMFERDSTDSAYKNYLHRYYSLHKAIISSGDGLSCPTAFKTIYVSDEYDIMYRYFEIPHHFSQSLVDDCDRFEIEPSEYFQSKKIFFDTSETLMDLERSFEQPKKKKDNKK